MFVHIIKAIKYDDAGFPIAVIWRPADPQENEWVGDEMEVSIEQVIVALDRGSTVYLEWFEKGYQVMGPKAQKTVYENGKPGIASADPERPLDELPYYEEFEPSDDFHD